MTKDSTTSAEKKESGFYINLKGLQSMVEGQPTHVSDGVHPTYTKVFLDEQCKEYFRSLEAKLKIASGALKKISRIGQDYYGQIPEVDIASKALSQLSL